MQNTNRNLWWGLVLATCIWSGAFAQGLSTTDPTAENTAGGGGFNQIFAIKTHVIEPILLSFFESDSDNYIQGEVFFPGVPSADRLVLEAFDSAGSLIYSQEFDVDLEVEKSQKFRLQVPSFGLPTGSRMEANLYNQENPIGRASRTLPQVEGGTTYRISDLEIIEGERTISVNLDFENGTLESLKVRPQIKIWQQTIVPEALVSRDFFEGTTIGGKSRADLSYSFATPKQPGLYRVEVVALGEDKSVLSGQQQAFFVVPGDFATFDGSFVTPIPGEAPGINLKFVGDYEGGDKNLTLELGINLFNKRGKLVERLTDTLTTPVSRGSFVQRFELGGSTDSLGKLEATAVLKSAAGDWLSEITHVEDFMKGHGFLSEEVVLEDDGDLMEMLPGWSWYHWSGLALAILLILLLTIWLVRSHKKPTQLILFLLLSVSSWGTAKAALEVFWHHPVQNWYYNANATGDFAEFGVVKIQGNIFNTLTQKGFFYEIPERIVVSFFKDLTYDEDGVRICTNCFYLEPSIASIDPDATCVNEDNYSGPDAEICDNKTYRFELDLPAAIEEGQWGAQVLFKLDGVWYGTNWADAGTGDWYRINFDSTPPGLTGALTYGGNPPPLNGNLVFEERGPIINGPTGLSARHAAISLNKSSKESATDDKNLLIFIANQKLQARFHKINVLLRGLEQAAENNPGQDYSSEIANVVDEIKALTSKFPQNPGLFNPNNPGQKSTWSTLGINDIAKVLGQGVPASLSGSPTALGLSSNYGVPQVVINPPAGQQANNPKSTLITNAQNIITSHENALPALKASLRSVNQIHESSAVEVGMACADPELETGVAGAGCNAASLLAPVRGNFCEYDEVCDDNAISTYEVCDQVGNCAYSTDIEAKIDWYDPVAPDAVDIDVIKFKDNIGGTETTITGDGSDNVFSAGERISIEIDGSDPVADYSTHPSLFDQNACGSGTSAFFYDTVPNPANDYCSQSEVRCPLSSSKRGVQDRSQAEACIGDCPAGYALQGDLCVPFCDFRLFNGCFPFLLIGDQCTVTAWLPDPATVPFGDPFTQVNNCGQTRQSTGTKSITGTLNHFLDGKEVFGAYIYDTTEDTLPLSYPLNINIDGGGAGGFVPYTSIENFADMTVETVNSPSAGRAFKVSTFDVAGPNRYGAWQRTGVSVSANTDYVLSYWVKTDATVNKNEEGAWVAITGNGPTTDIGAQYSATMEGVAGNLSWYKVIIPFTTPAGTTQIDIELRLQQQNSKVAYFDDVRIFEENWRFDSSQSWHSETLDDAGGDCDYIQTSGGVTIDGPDDRCGANRFPEKAVLVYTSDGFYIFDAEKGTFWMKAVQDSGSSVFGRFVFNELMSGQTFGLNGQLYLAHRFNEPNSSYDDRNGALEVMDLLNDEMYTHRMSGCYTLAGVKGTGSSYSTNNNCENNGYRNWTGFVNDTVSQRNVVRTYWSNEMPAGQQLSTHQINHASANVLGGKTYAAVASDYGITVLNKTDDTVKYLEWDGYHGDNYTWDYLHPDGSTYHKTYLEDDKSLWYKWDYRRSADDGSRIWKLNDVTSLIYNNGTITGSDIVDSQIQPTGFSGAYPTTAQDEDSKAFDVQGDIFLSGGDVGLEKFYGTLVGGDSSAHPDLAKSTINKNYATMPLYGNVLGHWTNGVSDVGDYDNDLTNQGSVSTSAVASGADLTQFDLNGSSQYLSSGSSDFSVSGPITFGTWVKTTGTEDGGYIMSKGNSTALDFAIYRNPDNTLTVTGTADTNIPGYTLSGWDHVVVTFDGTNKKTYLNGQLISTVADTKTVFDGSGGSASLTGRYIRVEKNTGSHLSLAEVQVFDSTNSTNLALVGTATQIDTGWSGPPENGIDGNTSGDHQNGSGAGPTTHTSSGTGALWWEVDLGAEYDLGNIVVWNRTDCCSSRLSGAVVSVLDASRNVVSASSALSSATTQTLALSVSNLPDTRYVRVEKSTTGTYPYLYLAEVQVSNLVGTNIATSGTASSYSAYTSANRAKDGDTDGEWYNSSVFRTNHSTGTTAWWEVDLGSEQSISDVTIWNRTDSRWDYLTGSIVKLLDNSRATVATSDPLSSNTTQAPVFTGGGSSSSLFIGTYPTDSAQSSKLLSGAVALPFVSEGDYSVSQVLDMYNKTVNWFNAGAKITLQGTSNNVLDVVFGDDDDYFVVTSYGITHFDEDGIMIRTLTTAASSSTNTQIISDDINDIDYKNRYLILAYADPDGGGAQQARGLEIITIGTESND